MKMVEVRWQEEMMGCQGKVVAEDRCLLEAASLLVEVRWREEMMGCQGNVVAEDRCLRETALLLCAQWYPGFGPSPVKLPLMPKTHRQVRLPWAQAILDHSGLLATEPPSHPWR